MNFNKQDFTLFRQDLKKALEQVEKKYGLRITPGQISYDSLSFVIKLTAEKTVGKNGEEIDPEKENFKQICNLYGLEPEDYKARCHITGESQTFIITGINQRARKNAIQITRESDGQKYVCSRAMIVLDRD